MNIFDYNFMDEPGEARLELTQLANIWGGGAVLRVDIETDNGRKSCKWLSAAPIMAILLLRIC